MKIKPLHFPTVLGGIVPAYNLPALQDLKFSPEALAGIFLGRITKWNDAILRKDNPGVNLPARDIVVVHRADGSGTSFVFTDYLAKVSREWARKVGPPSTSVKWPTGLGGKGNEGVAGQVKQTPGAIGYVELNYAVENQMEFGWLKNAAGCFVKADFHSVSAAGESAARDMPADFRVSITNAPGEDSYPIASFTWLLIPSRIPDNAKARTLKAFLQWMLADGQKYATGMSYAPLPQEVVAKAARQIGMIQ
jgi:phosphate transport system substrate-binding protein